MKFATHRFYQARANIEERHFENPDRYIEQGAVFLAQNTRYDYFLNMPEEENIGIAINAAMGLIEKHNPSLKGALPRGFNRLNSKTLKMILKAFDSDDFLIEGDAFGQVFEYFLGRFAMAEGQKGGVFYTPKSLVDLIIDILQPYNGKLLDPACGSGGMFVHSARFIDRHQGNRQAISIYGQEKIEDYVKIAKMNLAINGIDTDNIKQGNSYDTDTHNSIGKFDFVMANPPFNRKEWDKEIAKNDPRYKLGIPSSQNANYLWVQMFHSALNDTGRAGFVMASGAESSGSEVDIRRKLIETGDVDVMVAIGPKFFYTVTLPCTLWFLDKGKKETNKNKVLFIDARSIFTVMDRSHHTFTDEQMEFISGIVDLYRGNATQNSPSVKGWQSQTDGVVSETPTDKNTSPNKLGTPQNSPQNPNDLLQAKFPDGVYQDIKGLCKLATIEEIQAQNWSLNPGIYVGVEENIADEYDFVERMTELQTSWQELTQEAKSLETKITTNFNLIVE